MGIVLDLPDLSQLDADGVDGWIEFSLDREGARLLLRAILAMAVRDGASAVHYHPWRGDAMDSFAITYVVDGVQYGLMPPPRAHANDLLAAARELIAPRGLWAKMRRLFTKSRGNVTGRIQINSPGGDESEWCGVVWAAGGVEGMEFYRLESTNVD